MFYRRCRRLFLWSTFYKKWQTNDQNWPTWPINNQHLLNSSKHIQKIKNTDQADKKMIKTWLRHNALLPVRRCDAAEPPHPRKIRFETFIGLSRVHLLFFKPSTLSRLRSFCFLPFCYVQYTLKQLVEAPPIGWDFQISCGFSGIQSLGFFHIISNSAGQPGQQIVDFSHHNRLSSSAFQRTNLRFAPKWPARRGASVVI